MPRSVVVAVIAALGVVVSWFAENAAIHAAGYSGFGGAGWITAVIIPLGAGAWIWDKLGGSEAIANLKGTDGIADPKGTDGIADPKGTDGIANPKGSDGLATPSATTRLTPPHVRRPRLARRGLAPQERLVVLAASTLLVSMLLPWYGGTLGESPVGGPRVGPFTRSALGAFSFAEGAVLLLACGVLVLLFAPVEHRGIRMPGGERAMICAAGVLAALLILYRMVGKSGGNGIPQTATAVGLRWGIFLALACAIGLTYAGSRVRADRPLQRPIAAGDRVGSL